MGHSYTNQLPSLVSGMLWSSKSSRGASASDTGHQGHSGTHKLPTQPSEAAVLLPGRALLPNREQCRTRQETCSTSPELGPSRTAHLKSYPFPLTRTCSTLGSTTPGWQVCRLLGALPSAMARKGMRLPHQQSRGVCTSALC